MLAVALLLALQAPAAPTTRADSQAILGRAQALVGYTAHAAEDYLAAEAAYDRALLAMSPEQRCRWTDVTLLLPAAPAAYRALDCVARDSVERRFWWLADPLYLTPGNERRS